MDPVRNPYAPGAGQRPPELTGRDREIGQFEVVLERIARGRPERGTVLTGLRGVGETVPAACRHSRSSFSDTLLTAKTLANSREGFRDHGLAAITHQAPSGQLRVRNRPP